MPKAYDTMAGYLIVPPPPGLETGYVPIATRQARVENVQAGVTSSLLAHAQLLGARYHGPQELTSARPAPLDCDPEAEAE